jgi:DNA polymerase III subunit epsilon
MDFVALDVETANADLASICAIGLVHFKAGEVFRRLSILIDPEDEFDGINISIHGIEPKDVAGAPTMREVFPAVDKALGESVVVHHTHFDRVALCRAGTKHGFADLTCSWLDSARVARRAWERFSHNGYGLGNLAAEFGIEFQHHDAAEDARAAGLILLRAMAETGLSLDDWLIRAAQPLFGSVRGSHAQAGNSDGPLAGDVIVFTGRLQIARHEAAVMAAAAGCDVADRVTKDTTILVIGDQDVRHLRGHEKSAKHQKAEKMIREGAMLRIIGETDFRAFMSGAVGQDSNILGRQTA